MEDDFTCVVIPSPGGYDKLQVKKVTAPFSGRNASLPDLGKSVKFTIGKGEVLVRTHAVGVNYADVCIRMGLYESAKKFVGWPICPGFEFSGTVVAIGEEGEDEEIESKFKSKGIKIGSKVFGVTRFGAYASHVVVSKLFAYPLPSKLSLVEAAGFPAVWLTAYYAMFLEAHAQKGDVILVHSAAGGVGSALVQLGKSAGCKVVGVVGSTHKVEACKRLGADYVIDKSKENLWKRCEEISPEGFDSIYDANGIETLQQSFNHLACGGKLVIYGFHTMLPKQGGKPNWLKLVWDWLWTPRFNPLQMTTSSKSVMAFNLSFQFHKAKKFILIMDDLIQLLESGKIVSPKVTTYPLEEIVQAHKDIESGTTVGKLVLLT